MVYTETMLTEPFLQFLGECNFYRMIDSLNKASTLKHSVTITYDFVLAQSTKALQGFHLLARFRSPHSKVFQALSKYSARWVRLFLIDRNQLPDKSTIVRFEPVCHVQKTNVLTTRGQNVRGKVNCVDIKGRLIFRADFILVWI